MCHNVSTELHLQPMAGEVMSGLSVNTQDGVRLDIAAEGFGGGGGGGGGGLIQAGIYLM